MKSTKKTDRQSKSKSLKQSEKDPLDFTLKVKAKILGHASYELFENEMETILSTLLLDSPSTLIEFRSFDLEITSPKNFAESDTQDNKLPLAQVLKCGHCFSPLGYKWKFCVECGHPVEIESSQTISNIHDLGDYPDGFDPELYGL